MKHDLLTQTQEELTNVRALLQAEVRRSRELEQKLREAGDMMKLRPEVARFAEEMEKQLQANEHKGHWKDCRYSFLINELFRNYSRMLNAFMSNNASEILRRTANIGNFAMMIADNFGGLMEQALSGEGGAIPVKETQKFDCPITCNDDCFNPDNTECCRACPKLAECPEPCDGINMAGEGGGE